MRIDDVAPRSVCHAFDQSRVSERSLPILRPRVPDRDLQDRYNREIHSETGEAPIRRFLKGRSVMRPSPDSAALRLNNAATSLQPHYRASCLHQDPDAQRKSDGTLVIGGRRFEVPDRHRHLVSADFGFVKIQRSKRRRVTAVTSATAQRPAPQEAHEGSVRFRPTAGLSPQG
jgi:hypothetical protein